MRVTHVIDLSMWTLTIIVNRVYSCFSRFSYS